jgi:type II secretory pathway pseudopilin PulG
MHWPSWNADTAATVQALAAIVQGILTILALMAAIGIPLWQQWRGRVEDRASRAAELAGLRHALHTEVGAIGLQCLIELDTWTKAPAPAAPKNLRTAKLPHLTIYEANASRIGLLARNEIIGLIGFSGTLHDLSIVVEDMERRQAQGPDDRQTLRISFPMPVAARQTSSKPSLALRMPRKIAPSSRS